MLVRLFGSNSRSLKDPFDLAMVAADLKRKEDRNRGVVKVPIDGMSEPLSLLRVVGVYGANASGKSTVLTAGYALHWLVTSSSPQSKPDRPIPPYEPFLLDKSTQNAPVELGCDVVYKKSILRYQITYGRKAIQTETLSILNGNDEVKLIVRQPSGEVHGTLISGSEANKLYVKEMQPNIAVLSKLAQHGPHRGKDSVQPYHRAIRNALRWEDYSDVANVQIRLGGSADERFAGDADYREWIMNHLIRAADVGIRDVLTDRESINVPDELRQQFEKSYQGLTFPESRVVISFVHEGTVPTTIDFSDESSGTKKLFNIAEDWWTLAKEPITLFADELGASLHPRLLDRLIRAVNDPPKGRPRSQLIFATHDTGLLESQDGEPPALRRDQVYFTKKDAAGATELYSLAEFREDARPVHNIRKRYMSGLYGAIPAVEKLSL